MLGLDALRSWLSLGFGAPPFEEQLSVNDATEILSNERRRLTIDTVGRLGQTTTGEVTDTVAAAENELPPGQLNSAERQRVRVSLYQTHLKKLDAAGVIDYNKDRNRIEQGPAFEHGRYLLEQLREDCDGPDALIDPTEIPLGGEADA